MNWQASSKPQYHSWLILRLLVYCYANGVFLSRRIDQATSRDIGARFFAAHTHPDHDTIATLRRTKRRRLWKYRCWREIGMLKVGTVSIDGTKIDANASKIRVMRYDCDQALRAKLATEIAELTAKAEAADAEDIDPQALPGEMARREALIAKLAAAIAAMGQRMLTSCEPDGQLAGCRETSSLLISM